MLLHIVYFSGISTMVPDDKCVRKKMVGIIWPLPTTFCQNRAYIPRYKGVFIINGLVFVWQSCNYNRLLVMILVLCKVLPAMPSDLQAVPSNWFAQDAFHHFIAWRGGWMIPPYKWMDGHQIPLKETESWRKGIFPYQSGFFLPVPVPTTWSAPFRRQPSAWQLSRWPRVSEKSSGSISIVEVSNINGYVGVCPPSVIGIPTPFPTKSTYLLSLWIF